LALTWQERADEAGFGRKLQEKLVSGAIDRAADRDRTSKLKTEAVYAA